LGLSVAVSGDGNTIVAGAPFFNNQQGAAYVFVKSGGRWANATQSAKLTASDGASIAFFGASIGISGDGSSIAAGAYNDSATNSPQTATLSGFAFVFNP